MTNTIFSTVDHFATCFKLVDSLINTIAGQLLPRHEVKGSDVILANMSAIRPAWPGICATLIAILAMLVAVTARA